MARVLHLIASNQRRGAETFGVELAAHLRQAGHEVEVMAIVDSRVDEPLPVRVAGTARFDPAGIARIVRAARWADVVTSFGSISLITGSAVARLTRTPFVYRNIGDPAVWGAARLSGIRVGMPARSAARIVALYPDAALTLTNLYRIDPERIRIIPRGVPEERFTPADDEERLAARRALGLDPSMHWLSYIGALSVEKDPELALRTLDELPPDVGLVVAGDGPMFDAVTRAAERFGDRVRLLGVVDDVRPVLAASDALILPSKTEGIPGAAIEASLSGIPVVATRVGGVPHVVEDGVGGFVVTPGSASELADAARKAIERRDELGAAARALSLERFSMRAVGAAWEAVIAELAGRTEPGREARILQVTATADRRGAEVFAHQLGAALALDGVMTHTVAVSGQHDATSLPIRVIGKGRFRPLTIVRLFRLSRRHDAIVVHGSSGLWPAVLVSLVTRRRFIYRSIGDPVYWGRVRFGGLRIGVPLRRARFVVALYPEAAAWMIRRYRLRPDRVVVLPNGVDAAEFAPVDDQTRARRRAALGIGDAGPVLGYLGALSEEKRPTLALEAAAAVDGATLVFAGRGPLRARLEALGDEIAPGRVRFLETTDDPAAFLAAIDVLLVPSRTEGMPAAMIEAALTGTAIVATDVGGVSSLLEDIPNGHLVAADDEAAFIDTVRRVVAEAPRPAPDRELIRSRYDVGALAPRWTELIRTAQRDTSHT